MIPAASPAPAGSSAASISHLSGTDGALADGAPGTRPACPPAARFLRALAAGGALLACLSAPWPTAGDAREPASGVSDTLRELVEAERGAPGFLHPDTAFRVDASAQGPASVVVRWTVEPGYYLYRKRIEVALAEPFPEGTSLAGVELPPGEVLQDPYFGQVEVFRSETGAIVRLHHLGDPPPAASLAVLYQGCADAGLCYPPIRKILRVRFGDPAAGTVAPRPVLAPSGTMPGAGTGGVGGALDPPLSDTDRIARFLAVDGLGASIAAFFGFGLLLSFTPCVFPMIPILSSILVADGRAGRVRGFSLSLTYVTASALAWAAAGGVAGLVGANVQAALQNPWVLGAVGGAFVVLALSMFGFFRLELPSAWLTRATGWTNRAAGGGGYAGAAAMGLASALIVGPCIAAPMAGAVLYIGQAGDAVRGGAALFAMGFGMGVPLLVLGTSSGRWLPRSGRWMDAIQHAAGVLLLGVAAYLLERIVPAWAAMAGWAIVAVAAGIVFARTAWPHPARASGPRWLRRASGTAAAVAAVYAAVLLAGAATGAHDPLHPLAGLRPSTDPGRIEFIPVKGLSGPAGLEAALARAEAAGRFVLLDFYADWCVSCKEMEETTFRDPKVLAALAGVRLLRADVTRNDEADRALMKRLGVLGPPTLLFFGPDRIERRRYRTVGFENAEEFTARVAGAVDAA